MFCEHREFWHGVQLEISALILPGDSLQDKVEVLLAVDAAQVVQEEVVRRAAAAPNAVLAAVAEAGRSVSYWKGGQAHMMSKLQGSAKRLFPGCVKLGE